MTHGLPQGWTAVRRSALRSKKINGLSLGAECLFWRLLLACDDAGRHPADPGEMSVGPLSRRFLSGTVTQLEADSWLSELVRAELVTLYDVDGERFLQVLQHETKMRTPAVLFPDPAEGVVMPVSEPDGGPSGHERGTRGADAPPDRIGQDKTGQDKGAAPRARSPRKTGGSRKKNPDPNAFRAWTLPDALDRPEVKAALDAWRDMRTHRRKKGRKRLTQRAADRATADLERLAQGDYVRAVQLVELADDEEWLGFHEPERGPLAERNGTPKPTKVAAVDAAKFLEDRGWSLAAVDGKIVATPLAGALYGRIDVGEAKAILDPVRDELVELLQAEAAT